MARSWALSLGAVMREAGLQGNIAWKLSCRSDEIHLDTLRALQGCGLTHVYMGVESGSLHDLATMRKHIKPEQHIEAGRVLRTLGLSFDFGFMLMQPYSTFESVRENILFLDDFVGDGWTDAGFCRLLPYAGTPIRTRLEADGRLLGTPFEPDYRFLDPRLDLYHAWLMDTFHARNFTSSGLSHILRALHFELNLPGSRVTPFERRWLRHLTATSNRLATYTLRAALDHVEARTLGEILGDPSYLLGLTRYEGAEEARIHEQILAFYEGVQDRAEAPMTLPERPSITEG